VKRITAQELDATVLRLEELQVEEEKLRSKLREQIEEFGFTPPRADKSKRLLGDVFQFTLSSSQSNEIRDAEVERIRSACPDGLFRQLFVTITKYKLASGAMALFAGKLPQNSPRNLRMLFNRAVLVKEGSLRLRIEKIEAA
jgi:hypothetical protein